MTTIQQLIDANGGLADGQTLTVHVTGYHPLIIERDGNEISVGFYVTDADGEMHADPAVNFTFRGKVWTPVSMEIGDRVINQPAYLRRFCRNWDKELAADDFATAQ